MPVLLVVGTARAGVGAKMRPDSPNPVSIDATEHFRHVTNQPMVLRLCKTPALRELLRYLDETFPYTIRPGEPPTRNPPPGRTTKKAGPQRQNSTPGTRFDLLAASRFLPL